MVTMLTPITIIMNLFLFGKRYFSEPVVLIAATLVTFIILAISWQLHTMVAVLVRNRWPEDRQMFQRLPMAITIFILMTSLCTTLIFFGYDYTGFLGYQLNESNYTWAIIFGVIENIFVTFLHEGVSSYEKWRATIRETETLKKEYLQTQLLGLKSQISPHFLFNSLNTLSSLISEDQDKAERFLDEMSKVYRYLLRNNDDPMVTLATELGFVESYFYLLKSRYGQSITFHIEVGKEWQNKKLPPYTLQTIIENTVRTNRMSKEDPLTIRLFINAEGRLCIENSHQPKIRPEEEEEDAGLYNIANKYRLLGLQPVIIEEGETIRSIRLPLISDTETFAA